MKLASSSIIDRQEISGISNDEGSSKEYLAYSRPSEASTSRENKPVVARPPPGLNLHNLRTGMALEGTVMSCTPYAAFIDLHVYRASKGGSYASVNGMLHVDDIDPALKQRGRVNRNRISESLYSLERGVPLTVYVKEVFKNAG